MYNIIINPDLNECWIKPGGHEERLSEKHRLQYMGLQKYMACVWVSVFAGVVIAQSGYSYGFVYRLEKGTISKSPWSGDIKKSSARMHCSLGAAVFPHGELLFLAWMCPMNVSWSPRKDTTGKKKINRSKRDELNHSSFCLCYKSAVWNIGCLCTAL